MGARDPVQTLTAKPAFWRSGPWAQCALMSQDPAPSGGAACAPGALLEQETGALVPEQQ